MATPAGPKGKPTTKEARAIPDETELVTNQSLPRPWLANSHVEAVPGGIQSAAIVKPAKIRAACSHLGPRTTRVNGRASANNKPIERKLTKAMASNTCRNVRR